MKQLPICLMSSFFALFAFSAINAQVSCGATAPVNTIGVGPYGINSSVQSTAATLTTNASSQLPNVEYILTLRGTPALNSQSTPDTTGGGGDVIIGTDNDGAFFAPSAGRYGTTISVGDTIDVSAIGYNLAQAKTLFGALLNNDISPGNPCCNIFTLTNAGGFCDSLNSAGIFDASDINNFGDVLVCYEALFDAQLSIESLIFNMNLFNSYQTLIPSSCGGGSFPVCYGVNRTARYGWPVSTANSIEKLSDAAADFQVYPNPSPAGEVKLNITSTKAVDLSVNLYSLLGEKVFSKKLGIVNGISSVEISVATLTAGAYFVELSDGKNKEVRKLIVK